MAFKRNGGIILWSDDTVEQWDDMRIVPGAFQFAGSADPTLSTWQPGGAGATFRVYEFNTNDEVFFTTQTPHTYKEGTDFKPHVHWTPRNVGVTESGNTVNWAMDFSIANVNGIFAASTNVALSDTCSGNDDQHEVSASGTITGTGITISSMIMGRLYRNTGDTWTSNGAGGRPVLLEIDIHFQLDTPGGSNSESTKT